MTLKLHSVGRGCVGPSVSLCQFTGSHSTVAVKSNITHRLSAIQSGDDADLKRLFKTIRHTKPISAP